MKAARFSFRAVKGAEAGNLEDDRTALGYQLSHS